jgi:hypothetical protein
MKKVYDPRFVNHGLSSCGFILAILDRWCFRQLETPGLRTS